MLGTPPAFVLSQDQTLKKLYLNNLSVAQIKFLNNLLLAILLKNFRWLKFDFTRNLNNSLIVQGVTCSSLRYSIYKVQLLARVFEAAWPRSELLYVITSFQVCQELFSSFFKFFRAVFLVALTGT